MSDSTRSTTIARSRDETVEDMPRWVKGCGLLSLAWTLAFVLVSLHVAWLLIPIVWLGAAALIRAGETLLDRLVLSALMVAGYVMAAGVALSIWPWGLAPASIAGLALSVIILIWTVSGRRLHLPRPRWTDAAPVGVSLVVTTLAALPYLRATGFAGVLAAVMSGEDSSRHASLVDQIRATGAYTFIHPRMTSDILNPGMADYPQGWHLFVAVIENFLTSTTRLGSSESSIILLAIMMLATFWALMLVVTWGAGRVAGPRRTVGAYVLIVVVAGWLAAWSELARTIVHLYCAEMACLVFFAGLVVAVVRPAIKVRDQIALLSALTIGVGFTYYLFLPIALVIAFGAVIMDRRRMKCVAFSVAVGVLLSGVSPMPAVAALILGRRDGQITLGKLTGIRPVELAAFALLVVAGVVLGRREPGWRRYAIPLLTTSAAGGAVYLYQRYSGSDPGYYFGKMLHFGVLVLILGLGAVGEVTGPLLRRLSGRVGVRVAAAMGVLAACAVGQVAIGRPSLAAVPWLTQQASGKFAHTAWAQTIVEIYRSCPTEPDIPTVVFYGDRAKNFGYNDSIFLAVLQRQAGKGYRETYGLTWTSPEKRADHLVRRAGKHVRVVLGDAEARAALIAALRAHPERASRIVPVELSGIAVTGECRAGLS
jgi:hypothetical protein